MSSAHSMNARKCVNVLNKTLLLSVKYLCMNQVRSEEEENGSKSDRKDRGHEADGKKAAQQNKNTVEN